MEAISNPLIEANVSNLMNEADEEVWKAAGLFDQVDSAVLGTATINTPSLLPQLPTRKQSLHTSPSTLSFTEFLRPSSVSPRATIGTTGFQPQQSLDKGSLCLLV
jgi:hypothetical protein